MTADKRRLTRVNFRALGAARLTAMCVIALALATVAGCGLSKEQERQAVAAVTPWLELIDAERYDEAWDGTLDYFKGTTASSRWIELMRSYRRPLGKVLSRSMDEVRREESLPGAPDANYVVIKFNTVFERKKKAVETVITIASQTGQFGVIGYYVQ